MADRNGLVGDIGVAFEHSTATRRASRRTCRRAIRAGRSWSSRLAHEPLSLRCGARILLRASISRSFFESGQDEPLVARNSAVAHRRGRTRGHPVSRRAIASRPAIASARRGLLPPRLAYKPPTPRRAEPFQRADYLPERSTRTTGLIANPELTGTGFNAAALSHRANRYRVKLPESRLRARPLRCGCRAVDSGAADKWGHALAGEARSPRQHAYAKRCTTYAVRPRRCVRARGSLRSSRKCGSSRRQRSECDPPLLRGELLSAAELAALTAHPSQPRAKAATMPVKRDVVRAACARSLVRNGSSSTRPICRIEDPLLPKGTGLVRGGDFHEDLGRSCSS